MFLNHPEIEWDWYKLSANPSITMQDVLNHPSLNWKWDYLSANPSITMQDVLNHPEIKWDWYALSINPAITLFNIENNLNKPWLWRVFPHAKFANREKIIRKQCIKEFRAINIIKKNWIKVFWNPEYRIGRKRLERSFSNEEYQVW